MFERQTSKSFRTAMKRREKKLGEVPGFTITETATRAERLELLETYFVQKARQFSEMGALNVFADPPIAAFYRALAGADADLEPIHTTHAARIGDQILATGSGVRHNGRYYLLTASLGEDNEHSKHSPGLLVFRRQIEQLMTEGTGYYDFGAGEGRHKSSWSPDRVELFETFLPLTAAGWAWSMVRSGKSYAKRIVKSNERVFAFAKEMRRMLHGGKSAAVQPGTDA